MHIHFSIYIYIYLLVNIQLHHLPHNLSSELLQEIISFLSFSFLFCIILWVFSLLFYRRRTYFVSFILINFEDKEYSLGILDFIISSSYWGKALLNNPLLQVITQKWSICGRLSTRALIMVILGIGFNYIHSFS